jgi:serine/threonine protein kinase
MHRDLKLENILLTSSKPFEADAKLADFGLARKVQADGTQAAPQLTPM